MIIKRLSEVGCKTALRLTERAIFTAGIQKEFPSQEELKTAQLSALDELLDDLAGDEAMATRVCEVV